MRSEPTRLLFVTPVLAAGTLQPPTEQDVPEDAQGPVPDWLVVPAILVAVALLAAIAWILKRLRFGGPWLRGGGPTP